LTVFNNRKYPIFIFVFSISLSGIVLAETSKDMKDGKDEALSLKAPAQKDQKIETRKGDKWFAIDKVQHFSYSCLISLGCQYVLVNKFDNTEEESLPMSSAMSLGAGLLKELNDSRDNDGLFSLKDMVANMAGIALAALIIDQ